MLFLAEEHFWAEDWLSIAIFAFVAAVFLGGLVIACVCGFEIFFVLIFILAILHFLKNISFSSELLAFIVLQIVSFWFSALSELAHMFASSESILVTDSLQGNSLFGDDGEWEHESC